MSAEQVNEWCRDMRRAYYRARGRSLSWSDRAGLRVHRGSVHVRMTERERELERAADRLLASVR